MLSVVRCSLLAVCCCSLPDVGHGAVCCLSFAVFGDCDVFVVRCVLPAACCSPFVVCCLLFLGD